MQQFKPPGAQKKGRLAFVDHLRIVLTALVVFHHTASVYGGAGDWYWREEQSHSNLLLVGFNAINQSFFMGFFFLLAGYFGAAALAIKPTMEFVRERARRLGVPLLCYFVLISPFTRWLTLGDNRPSFALTWLSLLRNGQLEPGPLWFAASLIMLSLCLVIWLRTHGKIPQALALPKFSTLLILALALGLATFGLRILTPVGATYAWLQLGYFPGYVLLFILGCLAYPQRLLLRVSFKQALPWMIIAAAALLSLPFALRGAFGSGPFEGGWNSNALYYAFWDPLLAWGVILGALWAARRFWHRETRATAFLARRAYAVFIIHPPVLVAISVALADWSADPLLKFPVTALAALLGCVAAASMLLAIPHLRRIL